MPIGPNKAIATGATGGAVVVVVWALSLWGITIPPEVASAVSTLLMFAATWFTPHGGAK